MFWNMRCRDRCGKQNCLPGRKALNSRSVAIGTFRTMGVFHCQPSCGCPSTALERSQKRSGASPTPGSTRDNFWEGVVMIYTQETLDEVAVTIPLVVAAYNHIAEATSTPADFE